MNQAALLTPATEAELALFGVAVGTVGALAGVGGGFLVVPVLLLAFHLPPAVAAGTSLVMVAANALAGSLLHGRRGLLDWRGGLFLTGTAYPGTLLGAHFGARLRSEHFTLAFGLLLVAMAAAWRPSTPASCDGAPVPPRWPRAYPPPGARRTALPLPVQPPPPGGSHLGEPRRRRLPPALAGRAGTGVCAKLWSSGAAPSTPTASRCPSAASSAWGWAPWGPLWASGADPSSSRG